MNQKMRIGIRLRAISFDESFFVDTLISEKKSDESIIDQVKALRFGKRIEHLKSLLKEAGYCDIRIGDLVEEYMPDLFSTKEIKKILNSIKSSCTAA